MFKFKKLLSGLLISTIVTASVPAVVSQAEEIFDVSDESYLINSWTVSKMPDEASTYFNYIDNFVQPTEKYARTGNYALYIDYKDKEVANTYIALTNRNAITLDAGDYTFEFWAKGSYDYSNAIHTGTYDSYYYNVADFNTDFTDADGWTRYYKTFTVEEAQTNRPFRIFVQATANMVIDDMSLYSNDDSDKNLLYDGGFEEAKKLDIAENKYSVKEWNIEKRNIDSKLADRIIFAEVTNKDAYNAGGKSFHVVYPTSRSYSGTLIRCTQEGTFKGGTTYHLSFKAKGDFYFVGGLDWAEAQFDTNSGKKTELENGWVQYDYDLTSNSNQTLFRFDFNREIYDLYLDDVSLTAPGSTENLIKNGDFEKADIVNFGVENEKGLLKLNSWEHIYAQVDQTKNNYMQPTKKYARSGKYGMYFNYEDAYVADTYMLLQNANTVALPAGDYKMEFYSMGTFPNWAVYCGIYWPSYTAREDINLWSREVCDDGWIKHTYEFTVSADDTKNRNFGFHIQKNAKLVVDDVKLVNKNAPDVNLINDGGFDDVTETVIPTDIINPVAYPVKAGGAVSLSWKNPDTTFISDFKVLVNGIKYAGLTFDTTANAINECVVEGLTNGEESEISIVPIIRGKEYPVTLKTVPNVWYDMKFGDWRVEFGDNISDSGKYYSNTIAEIAEENGNKFISLQTNTNAKAYIGDVYARAVQNVTLEKSKKYRLLGKYKLEGTVNHLALAQNGEGLYHAPDILPWGHNASYGEWTEFSVDLSTKFYDPYSDEKYETDIAIFTDRANGKIMLDDIGVYEIDVYDETQIIGSNLLRNGGFDYDEYKIENTAFYLVEGETKTAIDKIQVGTVEVSTTIRNYSLDKFNAVVVVALYNDGNLEEVTIMERKVPQLALSVPADRYVTTVNVPSAANYEIKVMYWDGMDTIKPLKNADILN